MNMFSDPKLGQIFSTPNRMISKSVQLTAEPHSLDTLSWKDGENLDIVDIQDLVLNFVQSK